MIMLKGMSIVLRDWRLDDLDHHAYWLRPGHRWKEFDGPYYEGPAEDEIPAIIEHTREIIESGVLPRPRTSLVIDSQASNTLLGIVTWWWESIETYWPQVGIAIFDPSCWGRGMGYEALGLWTDYLFHELPQVVRMDLRTWSGNIRMMRVAEKLGYREEARFRNARIVNGVYYDGLGYGVLREEWATYYPAGFGTALYNRADAKL